MLSSELAGSRLPSSDPDFQTDTKLIDENRKLQSRLDSALSQIQSQKNRIQVFMDNARTDSLTGLPNRRAFDEELRLLLTQFHQHGTPFSMLLVEIDQFKEFNDSNGRQSGDLMLQRITVALGCIRDVGLVARIGGDVFAVILPAINLTGAFKVANFLRKSVRHEKIEFKGAQLHVTVSVGLAEAAFKEGMISIFNRANKGLNTAKNAGRDCCYFHDGEECKPIQEHELDAPLAEKHKSQTRMIPDPTAQMRQSLRNNPQSPHHSQSAADLLSFNSSSQLESARSSETNLDESCR